MNLNEKVLTISKDKKINFLLKSGLYEEKTLRKIDEEELNTLFITGLDATGFKMLGV